MNPIIFELAAVVIRWALTSLGGYLVAQHVLTSDQSDRFTNAIIEHAMLYAPAAAGLLWMLIAKYRARVKFLTALEMPMGSSEHQVKLAIKNGDAAPISQV